MRLLALWEMVLPISLAIVLVGCGGSSTSLFVVLNPSGNQSVDQNQTIDFTAFVSNDTSNAGVSWGLSSPRCKGAACGVLVNSTSTSVTYQAPKSTANLLTVTLTATSIADPRATATLNINVNPAPSIGTVSLPGMLNGANYSEQIVANGGAAPLVFSISSGSLPPGLHLNTNGLISGRTTANGGNYTFSVTVTDQGSPPLTDTRSYTVSVTPAPPLSVSTTALPNGVQGTLYNAPLSASGGVPPLTWSISSGSLPPGLSLTASTGQISGTPTSQGTFSFTVEVTDSSLLPPNQQPQTATSSLTITVGPPGTLTIVTTSLPQANSATLYSQQIRTTGGIGPFSWSITSGILPSGLSLDSSTGVISGTATAVSTNTFTVQVTDSESPAEQASATFTITVVASSTNDQLLNGNYAFVFNGYNSYGPVVLGGTFFANGGGVLVGSEDSNNNNPSGSTQNNGPGPTQNNGMGGTYNIGPDGRGTLDITVGTITSTYQFVLNGNGDGQFIESDNTGTHGTGILRKEATPNFTASNFKGNYAFELAGIDSSGKRAVYAGVFQADGVGLFKNGNVDTDDGGNVGTNISGSSGTFLVSQSGRGNASISIPGGPTLNFVFYMVTPSDVLFVGMDTLSSSAPMTTGEAVLQTQSSFGAGDLNGSSIATTTGQNSAGNSSVLIGLLSANGASSVNTTTDANDGGSLSTNAGGSGSYTVASNGRVATSGLSKQLAVIYLVSPNQGFIIGQDPESSEGTLEPQTFTGPYTAASFASYLTFGPAISGSSFTGSKGTNDFVGSILSDGISTITGKLDETSGSGAVSTNEAMKGSYTIAASGRGTMSFGSPTGLPSQFVFYMISPTQARAVSAIPADTQPMVFFLSH